MADVAAPPVFTVHQAMTSCGIDDVTLWQGATKAERIAEEIFTNSFETCLDITMDDLTKAFKTFADLRPN